VNDSAESVVRKFLGSFPAADVSDVVEFLSDDAVYIDGPRGVHTGIAAIRAELQAQLAMVPNTTVDIKALAADGSTVMTERVDNCEVNGRTIGFEVVGVFDVGADGRITRWRDYYDLPTFVEQMTSAMATHD
jgi:limonene-1,2-epoxide hydrolase